MKPYYKSKKVWVAVLTAVVTLLGPQLNLTPEQMMYLVVTGVALLGAIMGADWGKEAAMVAAALAMPDEVEELDVTATDEEKDSD